MLRGSSVSGRPRGRIVAAIAVSAALTGLLASCAGTDTGADVAAIGASTVSPSPSASPAGPPALVPDGTAYDNLPLFAAVTAQVWATEERAQGRAYIDALVAAGFDKERMQVTADRTTVGNPVESLQFSVAWDETECLIGQVGPSTGEPVTEVMPRLAEGRCLIGRTRPIDW